MKNRTLTTITIIISILLLTFSGCHVQEESNLNIYDSKISEIYEFLKEYKSSGKIEQYDIDSTISNIENSLNCTLSGIEGFGAQFYIFDVDEHLSFAIVDTPYTTCTFIIDGETYSSYDL